MDSYFGKEFKSFDAPASLFSSSSAPIVQRKRGADVTGLPGLFQQPAAKAKPPVPGPGLFPVQPMSATPMAQRPPPTSFADDNLTGMTSLSTSYGMPSKPVNSVFGTLLQRAKPPGGAQETEPEAVGVPVPGKVQEQPIPASACQLLSEVKQAGRELTDVEVGELRGMLKMNIEMGNALAAKLGARYKADLTEKSYERVTDGLEVPTEIEISVKVITKEAPASKDLGAYGVPVGGSDAGNGYGEPFSGGAAPNTLPPSLFAAKPKPGLLGDAGGPAMGGPFPRLPGGPLFRGPGVRPPGAPLLLRPGDGVRPRIGGPFGPPGPMGPAPLIPMRARPPMIPNEENPIVPPRRYLFDLRKIAPVIPPYILTNIRDLNVEKNASQDLSTRRVKNLKKFIFEKLFTQKVNPFPFVALCYRYIPKQAMDTAIDQKLKDRLSKISKEMGINEGEFALCMEGKIPQVLPPIMAQCKPVV